MSTTRAASSPAAAHPAAIVPDTKNWTWVLERRCPECGFDASCVPFREVPGLVRANAAAWPALLARPHARRRPDESTWSPLEYGAHVRDVFRVFRTRLALLRTEEAPLFPDWDQDATALADDYRAQDPAAVARELVTAGDVVAGDFESVGDDELARIGRRSDGSVFTVETLARYFVHDPIHHLHDVRGDAPAG